MQIVNGYVVDCSDDARLARRGVDPANPHNDPVKQKELDAKHGKIDTSALDEAKPGDLDPDRHEGPAVTFGGALAGETRDGGSASQPTQLVDLLA